MTVHRIAVEEKVTEVMRIQLPQNPIPEFVLPVEVEDTSYVMDRKKPAFVEELANQRLSLNKKMFNGGFWYFGTSTLSKLHRKRQQRLPSRRGLVCRN